MIWNNAIEIIGALFHASLSIVIYSKKYRAVPLKCGQFSKIYQQKAPYN